VTFNGEIYNYQALRNELSAAGHSFQTDCDTEVLVHAWEEYGTDMPSYLDGMFAFAICDETDETIFLARDRLGIKPLYYSRYNDELYWASEIQPLLRTGIDMELDEQAIYNYFNLRYFAWPQTPLTHIRKIPPGTSLLYDDGSISTQRFWSLKPSSTSGSRDHFADKFRTLFEESVKNRLMSDVPLGAFLSGGLDSSSIVAIMSEELDDFKTFSVGFEQSSYDESDEAAFVADHFGTDHHKITIDGDSIDLFGEVAKRYGEPVADSAAIPNLAISKYASEYVKVALSGEGADELFGGYWYNETVPKHMEILGSVPDFLFKIPWAIEPYSPARNQTLRYLSALKNTDTAIQGTIRQFDVPAERYLDADCTDEDIIEFVENTRKNVETDDYVKCMTAFDIKYYLSDDLLYKTDQSSMAASLEARVPFLDHKIVELAYSMPIELRQNGYKPVVNHAMQDLVPQRIRARDKHGFSVPVPEWLEQDQYAVTKWLEYEKLSQTPYIDTETIHELWAEHKEGKDRSGVLFKVISYVAWYHEIVREAKKCTER
jgi:asparagine synthase (glutamine-hydrolysing)